MRRIYFLGGIIGCLLVIAMPVQAATLDEALERMDEIIREMQSLRAEFNGLSTQVSNTGSSAPQGSVLGIKNRLTETIAFGETNEDIRLIQQLLRTDPEIYPYGVASGFFGPKTQEAIRNLQTRFGLDPVGVVGPATTALLEAFFAKYPDDIFPADALDGDPRVAGASTSATNNDFSSQIAAVQAEINRINNTNTSGDDGVRSIKAELDRGEATVKITYDNGDTDRIIVSGDDEDEVVEAIAKRTGLSESVVRANLDLEEEDDDDDDYDEDDAEDAIDDADDAIDDAQDEIEEAEDDGEDVDDAEDTLDDAKDALEEAEDAYDDEDWDEAVEKAEEAQELAEEAEDDIGGSSNKQGDSDEIDEIEVEVVDEDEAEVTVKYEDDDDYEFTVEEDKEDEIIEEIADELDIDEDDVEDLLDLDYGDVDEIDVLIDEDEEEAEVTVTYESGVERRFTINETDEDDIIEDIADEIDEDEDDVEDLTNFDYS